MASPNFWNIAHGEGERMRERRTVNLADPPLQKEKDPRLRAAGDRTQNRSKLHRRALIVNTLPGSNRELLISTSERLSALREFEELGGVR